MEHTKGEWKISRAAQEHPYSIEAQTKTIAFIKMQTESETTEANAKLIAAAPDLLECLEAIMPHVKGNDIYTEAEKGSLVWKCKQAINKTKGK